MSTTAQLSENSHHGFEVAKRMLCLAAMQAKSNTASGMPLCLRQNGIGSRSSSKERDAETGLDFFEARYYSGPQGRFLSVDPVIITPGRIRDPQQLNRYSYVRNNPLKYIDPDGENLFVSGDIESAKAELCNIIGGDCQRIEYDDKNKTITVNVSGLENNEGAMLLDQVANDTKANYGLTLGQEMKTKGGMLPLKGSKDIVNLDNRPDWRYGKGKRDIDLPLPALMLQ